MEGESRGRLIVASRGRGAAAASPTEDLFLRRGGAASSGLLSEVETRVMKATGGTRIGSYRILCLRGRGGMRVVNLAERARRADAGGFPGWRKVELCSTMVPVYLR